MATPIEKELLKQCIELLDNLENDKNQIPKHLWDYRNRLLFSAKSIGYEVYNKKNQKHYFDLSDYENI